MYVESSRSVILTRVQAEQLNLVSCLLDSLSLHPIICTTDCPFQLGRAAAPATIPTNTGEEPECPDQQKTHRPGRFYNIEQTMLLTDIFRCWKAIQIYSYQLVGRWYTRYRKPFGLHSSSAGHHNTQHSSWSFLKHFFQQRYITKAQSPERSIWFVRNHRVAWSHTGLGRLCFSFRPENLSSWFAEPTTRLTDWMALKHCHIYHAN